MYLCLHGSTCTGILVQTPHLFAISQTHHTNIFLFPFGLALRTAPAHPSVLPRISPQHPSLSPAFSSAFALSAPQCHRLHLGHLDFVSDIFYSFPHRLSLSSPTTGLAQRVPMNTYTLYSRVNPLRAFHHSDPPFQGCHFLTW
jgi:hypothetical protein